MTLTHSSFSSCGVFSGGCSASQSRSFPGSGVAPLWSSVAVIHRSSPNSIALSSLFSVSLPCPGGGAVPLWSSVAVIHRSSLNSIALSSLFSVSLSPYLQVHHTHSQSQNNSLKCTTFANKKSLKTLLLTTKSEEMHQYHHHHHHQWPTVTFPVTGHHHSLNAC